MQAKLKELKRNGNKIRRRPDMLWYLLLSSAATQGNARGWDGLFGNPTVRDSVSYENLSALSPAKREAQILAALRLAVVRMPTIKAPRLARNFTRILDQWGGIEAASQHMLKLVDREEKSKFIRSFEGIGQKYGRDIWMDIYDPAFRNVIAVDTRVANIAKALGLESGTYSDVESFFCSVADDCNLSPWEVDRLLYNFNGYFLDSVVGASKAAR